MDPNARYAAAAQKAISAPIWEGAGGFTYTLFDDGQVQVRDANGQVTYAQPGTEAHKAIMKETMRPEDRAELDAIGTPGEAAARRAREDAEMRRKAPTLMAEP